MSALDRLRAAEASKRGIRLSAIEVSSVLTHIDGLLTAIANVAICDECGATMTHAKSCRTGLDPDEKSEAEIEEELRETDRVKRTKR